MTEPGKFAPGLRGFPTPNTASGLNSYLLFLFEDELWAQYILGACEPLTAEYNWYEAGDMLPEEASEALRLVIQQAPYNLTETDVQAPFWDDESGDDADDSAAVADQTWYGIWDGETFLESVSYVLLTNFLSTLVGTGAAIKFLTIPRAFRVAIRQNPHGANLLLFLDGGLYKVINGYSPFDKVAEFLIASPGTELLLVVDDTHDPDATPNGDGEYVVDVIRKRLSLEEVTDPAVRYGGDPPVYQTTDDGGTTWTDQPGADPRYSPTSFFPPLTPYSGIECDTAARMTAQLKDSITLMCNVADAAQAVTGLLEIILLPEGLLGALLSLLFIICDWVIDEGQATILAAFTDTVYDDITCQLRCFIEPDGSITQSNLDAAWEQIKAAHTGTVATVIDEVRFLFTDAVFSNAGVKRTETGDCSGCDACDWFVEYDFTTHQLLGWNIYTDSFYGSYGGYNGAAFVGQRLPPHELFVFLHCPGTVITGSSYFGTTFHGTGGGNHLYVVDTTTNANPPAFTSESSNALPTVTDNWVVISTSFTTTDGYGIYMVVDSNDTGTITVKKIRLSGPGAPPPGGIRVSSLS